MDLIEKLHVWLGKNWNPDQTVAEWWSQLGLAGWAHPSLSPEAYGRGVSRAEALAISACIAEHGALGAPAGIGMTLAAPTIAKHGTRAQVEEFVEPIVTGRTSWCQLFSEPGAGSDLAGLRTRTVRDGGEWVVNGQKVWTSGGHIADMGMLLARTDADAPKHHGITWFAFDMHQPGAVDVRPLREMTGRTLFNEVFLSDARVSDSQVIGGLNNGWSVANSTLAFERLETGAGGESNAARARPGTVVGDLARRAGDFVRPRGPGSGGAAAMVANSRRLLVELGRANGSIADPSVRDRLARLHTLNEIARQTNLRAKAERARGRELPGVGNLGKLAMSEVIRTSRDLGLGILGATGTLHAYDPVDQQRLDEATGKPDAAHVTATALFAQAPPIYGGTDEIQRNIIGERVLGLPREPSVERTNR